ncbi:MAG: YdgA family protein, partial [Desulfobacterales bacterium]|nr:YdgA family protein [Desulfobacterales bacterium]
MKKVVLAVVLILVLAGAGTPFLSGMMMERTLRQSISDINRIYSETGSDISLEISQYDRNYSSSRIEWKIKLGTLASFYGFDEIVFLDRADHGFVRVVSHTSLEENKWFMDFVNQKLNGINPLEIKTEYNYIGDVETTVAMDGFRLTEGDDEIQVMPGHMTFTMDKGINNILTVGAWEGCTASDKLVMDKISINSKLAKLSSFIWDGS